MSKKKVLLLNPPTVAGDMVIKDQYCSFTSKAGYYWVPIDLLVLSGDLVHQFDLKVIDSIVEGLDYSATAQAVLDFSPDHIVILSSILTHEDDRALVRSLRQKTQFRTTFIGDVFYFAAREMIKFNEVDSLIYEYPCPELASFIENGSADCNIAYKEFDEIIFSPIRRLTEIKYHTPAHHLFDLNKYSVPFMQDEICTSVLTNFGCKYTCNYCPADSVSFRERSIEDILEEINYLKKMQIKNIWIRDFTFGLNKERTREFLSAIASLDIKWFCLSRSEVLDKQLLSDMARSGCYLIMIGVDTSNEETMKKVNRRQNLADLKNKIALANGFGMQVLVHMILGFPDDTVKNMLGTIHYLSGTKASFLSVNFFSPRAGSAYFKEGDIFKKDLKRLDSNFATNLGTLKEKITLNLLKYYGLVIFYFNPVRIVVILSKIRSRKQFLTIIKTGLKMFFPVSK